MTEDSEEINKREAVRVDTSFPVEFILLEEAGHADVVEEITNHGTDERLGIPPPAHGLPADMDNLKDYQEASPLVMKMWLSIDQKLDALMKIIGGQTHRLPDALKAMVKNISSKGVMLKAGKELAVGQHILIRMVPPVFPSFTIDAVGKVIEIDPTRPDGKHYNVEFTALNADDKEYLITYIFKRQREILRRRLEKEQEQEQEQENSPGD